MPNKYQAIQLFLESFGLPVYVDSSTPAEAKFPYITYNMIDGDFVSGELSMNVNVWYYTDSESKPNQKVFEMAKAIGYGGKLISYTGGAIWFKKGSPWCQSVKDGADDKIKRRYLNIDLEFITMD